MDIHEILLKYWSYGSFRPLQEQIIRSVLDGNDTLALMPTGGGKSLCYQVPTLTGKGICIVVSPLIALMKDQTEQLQKKGIGATAIFAGMRKREIDIALDACVYDPDMKFLYLSPERLQTELVRERIRYMPVRLIAVDEAHCISVWGYDFRPSYLQIAALRDLHPEVPILAVTATATSEVISDIQEKLYFREVKSRVYQSDLARENLALMVFEEPDKSRRLLRIIRNAGGSGIIYVRNRRETRELSRFLSEHGISAGYYHAGLDASTRHERQSAWGEEKIQVMVSTHAFGMGIDKSNVRFVVHMDIPEAPEAYYQEAGRAGRDGKGAYAVLLYEEADIRELKHKFELSFPSFEVIAQIYYKLGNYYQLAYGAGDQLAFPFDLQDFCKRFGLHPIQTLKAIGFLEKDGWLSLSEHVYLPARFKFEMPQSEVYRFQVEHEKWDGLIKALLRTYGGAFEQLTNIHEATIARKIRWSVASVQQALEHLEAQGLLRYIPKSDHPQLTFLRPRSDTAHLSVDATFIKTRKAIAQTKLEAMLGYIVTENCRMQSLLEFFDVNSGPCGICDRCIGKRKRKQSPDPHLATFVLDQLKSGPISLQELIEKLDKDKQEEGIKLVQDMVDSGKIKLNMNKFYLP